VWGDRRISKTGAKKVIGHRDKIQQMKKRKGHRAGGRKKKINRKEGSNAKGKTSVLRGVGKGWGENKKRGVGVKE